MSAAQRQSILSAELPPGRALIESALRAGQPALDEPMAKALLAAYGIPVPPGAAVEDPEEAVRLADQLGHPVVLKGLTATVQHKTDLGLVIGGVADEAGVRNAYRTLEAQAAAAGLALEGVLVERMVRGVREFVVGLSHDASFGPVVMFGLGGIHAEALQDVAFGLPPLSAEEAEELLENIKTRALLGPWRGAPAVDREALVSVMLALARIAEDHPEIREIEVNPLLVEDSRPVAVDALVALGSPVTRAARLPADPSLLDYLVAPESVVVVGASADTSKWGGMLVANLRLSGFPGRLYLVNPKGGRILGLAAYAQVRDLPEAPDLALIAVPAAAVPEALAECGRRGVRAAVVVSAGFSETGPVGQTLEAEVVETARRYNMLLLGPNCMGVISSHNRLYATGFLMVRPQPGGISMISQSGNLGTQLLAAAERRRGGVGKFVGVGNEAMLDAVDVIHYLRGDSQTSVIALYLEGFDDGRRLFEVVRRTTVEKPVVVLRGGLTDYGQKAAASHTGALASSAALFLAAARQSGMIVCTDPDEFMDVTFALSCLPLPTGGRVAVATMGGGWGVLVSDELFRSGLVLADLSPELRADLDDLLPPYWSHGNPVDLVATVTPGIPEAVVERLVADAGVDAVLVLGLVGSLSESKRVNRELERLKKLADAEDVELSTEQSPPTQEEPELSDRELAFVKRMAELMDEYCKPIINVSFKPIGQAVFPAGGRYSALVLSSPLPAVRVLDKMARYSDYLLRRGRPLPC